MVSIAKRGLTSWSAERALHDVSPSETLVPHFDCLLERGAIASAIVLNLNQPISGLIKSDVSAQLRLNYSEKNAIDTQVQPLFSSIKAGKKNSLIQVISTYRLVSVALNPCQSKD
jgi:hypothetical protein